MIAATMPRTSMQEEMLDLLRTDPEVRAALHGEDDVADQHEPL